VVVAGGDTRQASVAAGLAGVEPGIRTVLVHDAARAFTPAEVFERVIAAVASTGGGVIPVLPVIDTIKRVDGASVLETIDRSALVQVQTPQGFPREALDAAYRAATAEHTDDASLFAAAGGVVTSVAGDARSHKITTPADLRRAELEVGVPDSEGVSTGSTTGFRTGVGIDVHAYDAAEPLWLGGLYWPDEVGLSGHSDGDAMCHAICDALLSAAGLGDIGSRFGTSDPRFAGAHGDVFLTETVAVVTGAGYSISNVSVQLVANTPRLGERRSEIEAHLTQVVGAPVSVAATTSDGLGFTGKGEGVACVATALVQRAG
jgi:2-C-methyl-D-erythritol 4-phosphate cytidylyltransferase/2-C-methyl-D-erythritol 2,4-cyclodiphosphate synthase